eukprot:CAMPEP_0197855640 /NCGR_PEP_ID=MMETSP1438-20131217/27004_1 /TAXON_ID=1461541 /ORGANISM="Pterosperma sp., Strain CCMP1384" /LENGTH=205 /DNA_ID=CAMNT_0043470829 /DNA_START=54 /DNA_END=671 /DNA_ORIENTATION=-
MAPVDGVTGGPLPADLFSSPAPAGVSASPSLTPPAVPPTAAPPAAVTTQGPTSTSTSDVPFHQGNTFDAFGTSEAFQGGPTDNVPAFGSSAGFGASTDSFASFGTGGESGTSLNSTDGGSSVTPSVGTSMGSSVYTLANDSERSRGDSVVDDFNPFRNTDAAAPDKLESPTGTSGSHANAATAGSGDVVEDPFGSGDPFGSTPFG